MVSETSESKGAFPTPFIPHGLNFPTTNEETNVWGKIGLNINFTRAFEMFSSSLSRLKPCWRSDGHSDLRKKSFKAATGHENFAVLGKFNSVLKA